MKAHFRLLCLTLAMLCVGAASRAQISGTVTVPSTTYPTLKAAIDSLNLRGVGTSGATVNFTAFTNEIAPVGGYRLGSSTLNTSLTATSTLVINGNGNVLTAFTGAGTSDGIFYLMGTDYVRINNLNLAEASTNTTSTACMEWGYSLVKLSSTAPYDGCQFNTLNGCSVALKGNLSGHNPFGIRLAHTNAASTSILSTSSVTSASGNSYNKFTANIITGVSRGISSIGISTLAGYDKQNEFGGTTASTGNTIVLGGTTNAVYGTYTQYDSVITIQNNAISLASGQNSTIYMLYPLTGAGTLNVLNNRMDITSNTNATFYGYYNSSRSDAGATFNIIGNSITGTNSATSAGTFYGFYENQTAFNTLNLSSNSINSVRWDCVSMFLYYTYYNTSSVNINVTSNIVDGCINMNTSSNFYGYYNYQYYNANGKLSIANNRLDRVRLAGVYSYPFYNYGSYNVSSTVPGQRLSVVGNQIDSLDLSAVTSTYHYMYNYMAFYGPDSSECRNNRFTNSTLMTNTGSLYIYNYYGYGYYAPKDYKCNGNSFNNLTGNVYYMYNYMGYYANNVDSNSWRNIKMGVGTTPSTAGQLYTYLGMYSVAPQRVTRNVFADITTNGQVFYNFGGYYNTSRTYLADNQFRRIVLGGSGAFYNYMGYYGSAGVRLERTTVDSIFTTNGILYGLFSILTSGSPDTINNNIVSRIGTVGTATGLYGYILQSAASKTSFYNNIFSKPSLPAGYTGSTFYPVYLSGTNDYDVYHNTIYFNPNITGTGTYGATGLYYSAAVKSLDLRNNIINVNTLPQGTGNVVALRRAATAGAGVVPPNFAPTSNSNIFYAPNVANSFAYGEGLPTATITNGYNILNDANFNTPCGLFKNFMGHNKASFIEDNLAPGALPHTYVPTLFPTTFAESNATPTAPFSITTDYAYVTRATLADVGALEFNGTALDKAPPAISYTAINKRSYCSTAPTLAVTITDVTGVDVTGNPPRLYYKKSTDANAFGGNTSATSGWKYVNATSIVGSLFTFNFDYNLLTATVAPGDSISYFIIAQDIASTPNTGATVAGFAACPGNVALTSANAPTSNAPVINGFRVLTTPVFQIDALPQAVCISGSGLLTLVPTPVGAAVQWQSATLTGAFNNITGATNNTYNTGLLTTTMRYRTLVLCGTTTLATSTIDTFLVANPTLISVVGDTICGYDTARLTANAPAFTSALWYTTATGGSPIAAGNTYTTPYISSTRTYYVSGNVPHASTEVATITPATGTNNYYYTPYYQYGLEMEFKGTSTHFYSTTIYPQGSGNLQLRLVDVATGNTVKTSTVFTVTGGGGLSTPMVLNLNWFNIPKGVYWLVSDQGGTTTTGPNLLYEYLPTSPYPINSPSGNVVIRTGLTPGSNANYWCFWYYNTFSADCQSSTRTAVTALVTPAPAITVSSSNVPGICLGSSATISVNTAYAYYNYNWTTPPSTGTFSTAASFTVTPTKTTTYRVLARDPYTLCQAVDSVTLAVNPKPAPPTITPTNPTICQGGSVALTGAPDCGKPTVVDLGTATNSTGIYAQTAPNPYKYATSVGHDQYLIRPSELTAAGVCAGPISSVSFYVDIPYNASSGGYTTLDSYRVRIFQVPSTVTTLSTAVGYQNPYASTSKILGEYYNASFTPPSTAAQIGYNKFNLSYLNNWDGVSPIVVEIMWINCPGCSGISCYSYLYTGASIRYTPTSYTSCLYGYAYDCSNWGWPTSGVTYWTTSTARPNMRFDATSYWDMNWLNVSGLYKNTGLTTPVSLTDTNKVVYASPAVTTVYTAVTNAQGCLSNPSLPDTVFVNPAPIVTLTPSTTQTLCAGGVTTFCIPTGANQTYQWFLNNAPITGANSNCYNANAAGVYKVTATNVNTNCAATSANITVNVNALPTIAIAAGGATTFCNGGSVVLTASGTTGVTYQWQKNGVNLTGLPVSTNSTYTATTSGTYTVVVSGTNTCQNTSNSIVVTVNTTPTTVTPSGSKNICTGGSVTLAGPTTAGLTYQWRSAPIGSTTFANIAGATSSSYTATTSGYYVVVVTNSTTFCAATSAVDTVVVGTPPSSAITPSGNVGVCSGSTVTLSTNPAPGLTYDWKFNGTSTGSTGSTYTTGTAGSYTVTVSIAATPTCNSTTTTATVITVNPLPTATATPGGPTTFCAGGTNSVTLTANSGTGLSYQWNVNGTPIAGPAGTAASYVASTSGNYTVTVTTAAGCSTTSSPALAVNANSAGPVTITPATGTTFCQGGSVVLSASPSTGITTYQWKLNGSNVGTNSATYTATATGLYTVTVTNPQTCVATSPSTSVQVNALPDATTTPTGNTPVCQGSTTVLAVTNPAAGQSYQWRNNGVAITGANSSTFSTGTAGTYSVLITNTVTTCQAISANIVVTVNSLPTATNAATGPTTICQDDSVRLTANTGTGLGYQWRLNGNAIVGATSGIYFAKLGGNYSVAVTNAAGCTSTANPILVTVNPRPAAFITYNTPLDFCEGSAVVLRANAGAGLTYQWLMNGTPIGNTGDFNISSLSGIYALRVTNNFGCASNSVDLTVTVYPAPVPTILRAGNTLTTSTAYTNYQWFFNNDAVGGATTGSFDFTQNGAYKVRVVDANGCEGTSGQFFINNVGIVSTAAGKAIRVYPNPTSGTVKIDATVRVKVALRDVTGKTVIEASDVKEIDLGDVANGIYLLYISDMEGHLLRAEKVTKNGN